MGLGYFRVIVLHICAFGHKTVVVAGRIAPNTPQGVGPGEVIFGMAILDERRAADARASVVGPKLEIRAGTCGTCGAGFWIRGQSVSGQSGGGARRGGSEL